MTVPAARSPNNEVAAGYQGYVEVGIFNADVWAAPPDQTARTVRERFAAAQGTAAAG